MATLQLSPALAAYGITRTESGQIRTNGGEVHIPANLLPFNLGIPSLHLPGSEDGDPEFWTDDAFFDYCKDMAE